jgi:hypothetical protein
MKRVKSAGEAERFKPITEPVGEGECRVSGARVAAPDGRSLEQTDARVSGRSPGAPGNEVVLPWSERIRYAAKKLGYHGGGSPQEVLVPFGVYRSAADNSEVAGWREVARQTPDWWDLAVDARPANSAQEDTVGWAKRSVPNIRAPDINMPNIAAELRPSESRASLGKSSKRDDRTPDLFAQLAEQAPTEQDESDWIAALLGSPIYAQMKARSGRVRVSESQLRALLEGLEAAGGQQMSAAVAQRLGIPELRLNGFLAGVQKLLNVDGYPVLSIDRTSRTVRLDLQSLKAQFEL